MTLEAQRAAIAKVRGWTKCEGAFGIVPGAVTEAYRQPLPDYLKDLNAIREACLWAIDNLWNSDQVSDFAAHLDHRSPHYLFEDFYDTAQIIIRSTAEDWCYAFLKTSHLWDPDV